MYHQILYTACVTPFTQDGMAIDYISLEKLLRMQVRANNGLVIFGSTGEGLSISLQEKRKALEFICRLQLDTQLIVGVPSHNFAEALEWIDFCNNLPINGYLMTTPIYTKPGILGQTRWFESLLEASNYQAILYNIPSRAGIALHTETVKNLAKHPRFVAIKDSSGNVESIVDYQIIASNIAIYCGDDHLIPAMAAEGAVGLISVASNAWPQATRYYVHKALQGDLCMGTLWWKACRALFAASNPVPIKALLHEIGLISHDIVRLPLAREDFNSINDLIKYNKIINMFEEQNDGSS